MTTFNSLQSVIAIKASDQQPSLHPAACMHAHTLVISPSHLHNKHKYCKTNTHRDITKGVNKFYCNIHSLFTYSSYRRISEMA